MLKKCDGTQWTDIQVCDFGFNGESCNPPCQEGTVKCDPIESADQCMLKKCDGTQWTDIRVCEFGYDENTSNCVNPCTICDSTDIGKCPTTIYDSSSQTMYQCTEESGWSSTICINDFTRDESFHIKNEIDINKYKAQDVTENINNSALVYGKCGNCSEEQSPSFCSENKQFIYQCHNGEYLIDKANPDSCSNFNDLCQDSYGSIYVDLNTNRYHCGECNHTCGSIQRCEAGKCVSAVSCENHYTRISLGSRWIKAYCIETVDDLKHIGESKEYDNAYVLVNDLVINEPWAPINDFSNGILLGNGKTITIKRIESIYGFAGLFNEIRDTYVDGINIVFADEYISLVYSSIFGLLAAQAYSSTIRNIQIQGNIELSNVVSAGGLIGIASDVSISYITSDVSMNVIYFSDEVSSYDGIGGIIGTGININELSNIKQSNNSPVNITASDNAGGLIGVLMNTDSNTHQIRISNEDVKDSLSFSISGIENVGGLIGKILTNQNNYSIQLDNFNIEHVSLEVNESTESEPKLDKKNKPITKSRYFGGIIGRIENDQDDNTLNSALITLNDIKVSQVDVMNPGIMDSVSPSACLGGIAGAAENTSFQNIEIDKFENPNHALFISQIGGMVGFAQNSSISNTSINKFSLISVDSKANKVGSLAGELDNVSVSNIQAGVKTIDDSIIIHANAYLGGLVGRAYNNSIFDNIDIYETNIKASDGSNGGMIGDAQNVTINHTHVNNNIIECTKIISVESTKVYPIGGLIGRIENTTINNSTATSKVLSGQNGIGGFIGCPIGGTIHISNSKAFSKIEGSNKSHGGFFGLVCTGSQDIQISNCLAESNIHSSFYTGGFISGLAGTAHVQISQSSAYSFISISDNEASANITTNAVGGFTGFINNAGSINNTTAITNIITSPTYKFTSNPHRLMIQAASWNYDIVSSSSRLDNMIFSNISSITDAPKINYNHAIGYIQCPCCESKDDNCVCDSTNDAVYEYVTPYNASYELKCLKKCGDEEFTYNTLCHSDFTGYLSFATSYISNPFFIDGIFNNFLPYTYINDEPDWHTAELAEYKCECVTENPTSESDEVVKSVTYELEPKTDENCTCYQMWYELTCDVERFKQAIGCGENDCDGLLHKLNAQDGKFKHRVPISPNSHLTNSFDDSCDISDDMISIGEQCYDVLKPSFCDITD